MSPESSHFVDSDNFHPPKSLTPTPNPCIPNKFCTSHAHHRPLNSHSQYPKLCHSKINHSKTTQIANKKDSKSKLKKEKLFNQKRLSAQQSSKSLLSKVRSSLELTSKGLISIFLLGDNLIRRSRVIDDSDKKITESKKEIANSLWDEYDQEEQISILASSPNTPHDPQSPSGRNKILEDEDHDYVENNEKTPIMERYRSENQFEKQKTAKKRKDMRAIKSLNLKANNENCSLQNERLVNLDSGHKKGFCEHDIESQVASGLNKIYTISKKKG